MVDTSTISIAKQADPNYPKEQPTRKRRAAEVSKPLRPALLFLSIFPHLDPVLRGTG